MKVFIYALLLMTTVHQLSAQLLIKGEVLTDHKEVMLKVLDTQTLEYSPLETQKLKRDNTFEFKPDFNEANLYQIVFDEKEVLYLSVERPTTIYVRRTADSIHIEGSPSTLKMRAFKKQNEALQAKYFGKMKMELDQAMAKNDSARVQEIMAQADVVLQQFLQEFRALITDLGTTPAAYYAIQFSDFNKELEFIKTRLAAFETEHPNSPVTLALRTQVNQVEITGIGKLPPTFETTDLKNRPFSFADLRGKVILIDFWASWCRACRVENPKFVQLYQKYDQANFEIVSISQDDDHKSYIKAMEKDGVGLWTHIWDQDKAISNLYSVSSLPQNLVLNREGRIIAKNITADQLEELLGKQLH